VKTAMVTSQDSTLTEFSYLADVTDRAQIDAAGRESFRRFTDISFEGAGYITGQILGMNVNAFRHIHLSS
jgi:hypothetical protein